MGQYGQSPYGVEEYGGTMGLTEAPIISRYAPYPGQTGVAQDAKVSFWATDGNNDLDVSETVIKIDGVTAYENQTPKNGFTVVRTFIPYGYTYEVTAPSEFAFQAVVTAYVSVQDAVGNQVTQTWSFTVTKPAECFKGPLNSFEEKLLSPYTHSGVGDLLYNTERLRQLLLECAVDTPDPVEAIRALYLRAHSTELGVVLRDLVPTPTARERASVLCAKRTLLAIDQSLQRKPGLLDAALQELPGVGLTIEHLHLFVSYLNTNDPNVRVPLACVMVFIAKAFEDNELVA